MLRELKKQEALLTSVNTALLRTLDPAQIVVDIEQAGEAEIDEMWSFVGNKGNPAIPQKSPCACSLKCRPLLTEPIELSLGLSQGTALQAEPLAMCSKALPFLR